MTDGEYVAELTDYGWAPVLPGIDAEIAAAQARQEQADQAADQAA